MPDDKIEIFKYQIDERSELTSSIIFTQHVILELSEAKIHFERLAVKHVFGGRDKIRGQVIIEGFGDFLKFILRNQVRFCKIKCSCRDCTRQFFLDMSNLSHFLHHYNENIRRREWNCKHFVKKCPSQDAVTSCCKIMFEKFGLVDYAFSGDKPECMYIDEKTFAVGDDEEYLQPVQIPGIYTLSITDCPRFEWRDEYVRELNEANPMGLVEIAKKLFNIELDDCGLEERHTMDFEFE